ncbi:MAG: hypothetical protein WKG00_31345 [Polyangiaceae bacterium]
MLFKGAGIRSLLIAIERLEGAEGLAAVKAAAPAGVRARIEPQVLASRQYPVEISAALQIAVRDTIGGGSWEISHRLGVEAAYIDFKGIYRVFLRAMDYGSVWNRIERAFAQYNSQGSVKWTDRTRTSARGQVTGVIGYNDGMWSSVAGRVQGLLLLSGAKEASARAFDGTPQSCSFEATWRP